MSTPGVQSITRNATYLASAQALGFIARLVWVVAAARLLGPDLYAVLAYSQAWQLAFLPLALFGTGPAMSYLIGPDRSQAPAIAARGLGLRLLTTGIAAIACLGISSMVAPDPRAPALIAVLVLALIGRSLTTWTQTLFGAFEVNEFTLRQEVVFSLLDLVLALAILAGNLGLLALVSARAAVCCLQACRGLYIVHRNIVPVRVAWRPDDWRPLLSLAFPAFVITLAADWRFNGSMILFRSLTDDGVLFGQFAMAIQVLTLASILPLALSTGAYPALRRSVARGDNKDLLFASTMQRASWLAGTGAGLLGLALGEPIFRLLLGDSFSEAGRLVGVTAWCLIPLVASNGYPQSFIARGRFGTLVMASLASTVLLTGSMLVLAPTFGVLGAIAAAFIGFSVTPVLVFLLAWRMGLASIERELLRPLATTAFALLVYLSISPASVAGGLIVSLAVLAISSMLLGVVSRADLSQVRQLWQPASSPGQP